MPRIFDAKKGLLFFILECMSEIHWSPSSSGLGHRPFKAKTRVRVPLGTPRSLVSYMWCWLVILCLWCSKGWATLEVSITRGAFEPTPLALSCGGGGYVTQVRDLISQDLKNSGVFAIVYHKNTHAQGVSPQTMLASWPSSHKAHFLCVLTVAESSARMTVTCHLFDVVKKKEISSFSLVNQSKHWRRLAHKVSDRVYEAVTGTKGYFDTQIVYVEGLGEGSKKSFRLIMMDSDGFGYRPLRHFNTLVKMPYLDAEKDRVFYIRNSPKDRNRLFMLDLYWNSERAIKTPGDVFSVRPVLGANRLVLALKHNKGSGKSLDYSSIGFLDKSSHRFSYLLTPAACVYVSPTGSVHNGRVVFNSDHEGAPRIYETSLQGGWLRRLGDIEARYYSPMLSETNNALVFVRRDALGFHIVTLSKKGGRERVLATFDWAESPCWAPYGSAIIFSAKRHRKGVSKLYKIDMNSLKITAFQTPHEAIEPFWGERP